MSEIRLLHHFVAVYQHRSFRIAAERLSISQSTVTKNIQRLEQQLQMRLFHRTTRSVEPTDSARTLFNRAEQIIAAMGAFNDDARLLAGGELGRIRVGAIALAAETWITSSLVRLAASHPNLEVELVVGSSDVYHDLVTGECDVAIGDEANFLASSHATALRMLPLGSEELAIVHRSHHPASGTASLPTLLNYPLAIPSRYFNENRLFTALNQHTDTPIQPRYRLNSLSACLNLAAASNVVTLAPRSAVATGNRDIQVAKVALDINMRMVLVTLARSTQTPAIRAFHMACVGLNN